MKEILIGVVLVIVFVLLFGGFISWTNSIDCERYVEKNPGKEIRTQGLLNDCEVNYKGLWVSIYKFRNTLPEWE